MSSLTQEQLNKSLWAGADDMRKSMSADDYKDYLLGLVFFKNLSDEILYEVVDLVENRKPESLEEAQKIFERYYLDFSQVCERSSQWCELRYSQVQTAH